MGNQPSRGGRIDPRHRSLSYGTYTNRGRREKDYRHYDGDAPEDYQPEMTYGAPGSAQMSQYYGDPYAPVTQMAFPQPPMSSTMPPVVPGMVGAIPTAGNPFPTGPMNMNMGPGMPSPYYAPGMPSPQFAPGMPSPQFAPPAAAHGAERPVIPPLPASRRGRAGTPFVHPQEWPPSPSEDADNLTSEARARLQPPLAPGQYGPFDPVRDRTRFPQPILQRDGRRHRRAQSSPTFSHDSPPYDGPNQPPVIPPNFTGGPPFPQFPGVQQMPGVWPPQDLSANMNMNANMNYNAGAQQQPPERERSPFRPPPFEPIPISHNPLPAPPRDILQSSPYIGLLAELRKPIDEQALKARMGRVPAIHTIGAVSIPQPKQSQGTHSSKEKKKRGGLLRSLSHRLGGGSSRRSEEASNNASPPQMFLGGQSITIYPTVEHLPDGGVNLVYQPPPPVVGAQSMAVPLTSAPPVIPPPGSFMPGFVPNATPSMGVNSTNGIGTAHPGPAPSPTPSVIRPRPKRSPTPVTPRMGIDPPGESSALRSSTPAMPRLRIDRHGELSALLPFSLHRVGYDHRSYSTAQHLLEALKFLPHHPDLAEHVRSQGTVEEALAAAAGMREYWRPDWEQVKLEMLETVLYHKLTQHQSLREMLMWTGNADLVFFDEDTTLGDGKIDQGMNLLGRALMQVRRRLREEGFES